VALIQVKETQRGACSANSRAAGVVALKALREIPPTA